MSWILTGIERLSSLLCNGTCSPRTPTLCAFFCEVPFRRKALHQRRLVLCRIRGLFVTGRNKLLLRAAESEAVMGQIEARHEHERLLEQERVRVAAHLARAEQSARARRPEGLDPLQILVRELLLDALAEYREAGVFPRNHVREQRTPVFVDERGIRCAVGHLLFLGGAESLVKEISSTRNLATVFELADDPRLEEWLRAAGLSLEEAAAIQPGYGNYCGTAQSCFCEPRPNEGPYYPRPAVAVLDCTVLPGRTARVNFVYGDTADWRVGQEFSLNNISVYSGGRFLLPVGTAPGTSRVDGGLAPLTGFHVDDDNTVSCYAGNLGPPLVLRAHVNNVVEALLSSTCAADLARTEPASMDRHCTGCSCNIPTATKGPPTSLSILLSLVSALALWRARHPFRCASPPPKL